MNLRRIDRRQLFEDIGREAGERLQDSTDHGRKVAAREAAGASLAAAALAGSGG
jgi:hypothetical protein